MKRVIKKIVKNIFPEKIKTSLRSTENVLYRTVFGFSKPVILTDTFGSKFVLYPEEKWPIRWKMERSAYINEFAAMSKIVKENSVVFDIGANTGAISSFLSLKVGKNGKVYAFEPFPETFSRLQINISLNRFKNIISEEIALSNSEGTTQFFFDDTNAELNSLGKVDNGTSTSSKSVEVKVSTLDMYCQKNNIAFIDFAKIDVEGFEVEVLQGAKELLTNKKIKALQFEISPLPLRSANKKPEDILNFLKDVGYDVFDYNINKDEFTPVYNLTDAYNNYYAFPQK